jgi:hypothetical protein
MPKPKKSNRHWAGLLASIVEQVLNGRTLESHCGVMEWSAPPLREWHSAITEERNMTPPAIVGIDLGKNWFHLVGLDEGGATILRKKLNRAQLAEYAATAPRCIVATESDSAEARSPR